MNTIRQYIRQEDITIGLLLAFREGKDLKVGYSLLHPNDQKEIVTYNARVKRVNAESHRKNNALKAAGQEPTEPVEKYKPAFDKKLAFEIATENAASELKLAKHHVKIRSALHYFAGFAHWRLGGNFHFVE